MLVTKIAMGLTFFPTSSKTQEGPAFVGYLTFILKRPTIKDQTVHITEYNFVLNDLQPSLLAFSS